MARRTWEDKVEILKNIANGASMASEGRRIGRSQAVISGIAFRVLRTLNRAHGGLDDVHGSAAIRAARDRIIDCLDKPMPRPDGLPANISPMTYNTLRREGITTREEIIEALSSGKISINNGYGTIPGLGKKGILELCAAVGVEPALKQFAPASPLTIQRAIKTLERNGYTVIPPK